jgi:hypothetical protein
LGSVNDSNNKVDQKKIQERKAEIEKHNKECLEGKKK